MPPRRSTRKRSTATTTTPSRKKKKTAPSSPRDIKEDNMVVEKEVPPVEKMFGEICEADDPDTAGMEGIFALGEKLGIDATEDIRILVLLWKMKAGEQKPSQMSKKEWIQGCDSLNVESWESLKALIPSLDTGFLEQADFKNFYKFCFQFSRQGTHKSIDKDLAVALLKLVLGSTGDSNRIPTNRLETFTAFLEKSEGYTHMNLDQWTSFLDFCLLVPDLSNYDDSTSAWPVLLDEYVEYLEGLDGDNEKQKQLKKE